MVGWMATAGRPAGRWGSDYNASQPNWAVVGAELGNNMKTKIYMDILFHTCAKICAEPSHTLWTFSSIPMFIRTLADAQKDL